MRALGEPRGRWPWIEEARLDGGGDRSPRVRPRYDGYGVANVPVTALAALGAPHDGVPLAPEVAPPDLLRGVRVVLLVIVDALGYAHLRRAFAAGDAPTLAAAAEEGSLAPITSTFPSTTAAALTTLQTAAPPARHGMLGFTTYLREFGVLLNLIRFTPVGPFESRPGGLDLDGFLPVPTIYQRAAAAGVEAVAINFAPYQGSPLSRVQIRDAPYLPYRTLAEFGTQVRRAVAGPGKRLVVAYWPMVDLLGHHEGPDSEEVRAEVRMLDALLAAEVLRVDLGSDVLVILTADHGMIRLDPAEETMLSDDPTLLADLLVPPAGERRAAYFYPLPGRRAAVRERLREIAGERGWVVDSAELLAEGYFGPEPHMPEARWRVGELALIARGGASFPSRTPGEPIGRLIGAHGALDEEEMVVPCLLWRPG